MADLRAHRGYSAQQLSDRLASIGYEIGRGTIAHLENGRRSVSVPDLIAIAWALDVSPVVLLCDPSRPDDFAYLPPGRDEYRIWDFLDWWAGDRYPAPNRTISAERIHEHWSREKAYFDAMKPLHEWRNFEEAEERYGRMLNELTEARHRLMEAPGDERLARTVAALDAAFLDASKARDEAEENMPWRTSELLQAAFEDHLAETRRERNAQRRRQQDDGLHEFLEGGGSMLVLDGGGADPETASLPDEEQARAGRGDGHD